MKFKIYRVTNNPQKPCSKAKLDHIDKDKGKNYILEVDFLEDLLSVATENKTDITIYPPVPFMDDDTWEIQVNDEK